MSKQKKHKLLRRIKDRVAGAGHATPGAVSPLVHILFVVMILIGGVLYLVEVNETSTQGFKIRSLEQKVHNLEEIQHELELRQADVSSLNSLKENAKEMNLVAVDRVESLDEQGQLALSK